MAYLAGVRDSARDYGDYGNSDGRVGGRGGTTADKGIEMTDLACVGDYGNIKFDCKFGGRWRGLRGTKAI